MIALGFSVGHDSGAVLIKNGEVLVGISDERISRTKNSNNIDNTILPIKCIEYCLNEVGLDKSEVDIYVYNTTIECHDIIELQFKEWNPISTLEFAPHHLVHAYSSFYSSNFDESVIVVADAMGNVLTKGGKSWNWFNENSSLNLIDTSDEEYDWAEGITIYHVKNNKFEEVYKKWIKYPFPWEVGGEETSVGGYYGMGTLQLVYDKKTNSWKSGKLMGLASYADAKFVNEYPIQIQKQGNNVFIPTIINYPEINYESDFKSKSNVAGIYQREQEQVSMWLVEIAYELTNSSNICVAGGSFLNCNTNEKIINSGLFKNQYFVPPADDSGIPLGCAWYGYLKLNPSHKNPKQFQSPYFGKTYSKENILSDIEITSQYSRYSFNYYDNFEELIEIVANELKEGRVVGWFQGGSEIGPRALGNRSILANPQYQWMTNYVNELKGREWYRPFAPSVMYDKQSQVFELDYYSPYMLVTTHVKNKWKSKIPAVTHIDGTSRYQSVTKELNERYYKLINKFYSITNIPLLLNTSFNGPNEPIVESPKDAIDTFLKQGLHILVIGNFIFKQYK